MTFDFDFFALHLHVPLRLSTIGVSPSDLGSILQ
ncbi:BnaC03g42100D [Brassica napus]|uniref:(rape) hypothetical protein n=1 Tax=Brassica napus TaxID=3708 RepID=A0A078H3M4_BRANA|nr:unnamed protein product [Brassica napus]CDY32426.1 BnaC03g42100D [Brassica napus]